VCCGVLQHFFVSCSARIFHMFMKATCACSCSVSCCICVALQFVAVCCSMLPRVFLQRHVLHYLAVCFCILQWLAVPSCVFTTLLRGCRNPHRLPNTLQHTAKRCNTLQHTATHSNARHCNATHCNTTHCNSTHCNTLQHARLQKSAQVTDTL